MALRLGSEVELEIRHAALLRHLEIESVIVSDLALSPDAELEIRHAA